MTGQTGLFTVEYFMARKTLDWPTLLLLTAMYALMIGNFVVYWTMPGPLLVHVLIPVVAIHFAFTIWHEAAHNNVSRSQWLNNVAGVLGMFPYMTPYFMQRWVHLRHHAYLNEPGDPNLIYTDGSFWTVPLRYPRVLAYAGEVMASDPRSPGQKVSDACSVLLLTTIFAVAWWYGVLLDLVLLWFVPLVIAKLVMDWYINYLPHAGLPAHRYRGTRVLDIDWLTPLVLVHNYHAIHHLWPNIPWHRYRAVFRDKREQLVENGVPVETRIVGSTSYGARPAGEESISV